MRVAVVGGGVSGLAAAYVLAKEGVEVVVYEKEDFLGGGNAKIATLDDGTLIDLSFINFIKTTHPDLNNLFESVGVDLEVSDVSFSVSLDEGGGYEWGTRNGLQSLFSQKKNVFNPWFWKMIREIIKFRDDVSIYLEKLENNPEADRNETLANFVQSHSYSELFQKAFLIPICASIWSYSSRVMAFSAYLVLSFLSNHVAMELLGYPRRSTARWSSQSYVKKITEELESRSCCQVKINSEVYSVRTDDDGCVITNMDGLEEAYDECIITTHAPDALKILGKQATLDELRILGAFRYISSDIFLHHDDNLMPKNRATWGFRNVLGTTKDEIYTATYLLSNAQNISKRGVPFLLTLNPPFTPKDTLYKYLSSHLIPSIAASKASSEVSVIQGKRRVWFCAASQGCGLPEDGVKAGIINANNLLRKSYTIKNNPKCIVPSWVETGARVVVSKFLERFIVTGSVILLEEGGTIFTFEGTKRNSALRVTLRVHSPQFYWKVATEAEIGFAKAYINGDISFVDKNKGLFNFLLIIIANNELNNNPSKLNKKRGWWTQFLYTSLIASTKYFLKNVSSKNTLSKARQNVFQHYDLSNEFFSLFMNDNMDYSCAIFQTPGEDLKSAQLRKVHTLIAKARITKEHHILDIGCGWGALALEVVRKTGCKYTGITLSVNQLNYVESKVKEAGLQDRIEVLLCDYRQLPNNCKYDRIISCEMIEHVGHEFVEEFFKCCESALAENGLFVLQFSSVADDKYDEWRLGRGFIKEYIFPGGCLPSLSRLTSAMATASRLGVVHLEEIGPHYVDTLKYWRQNLLQNQSKILAMGFSEEFIRTWEYYFDYCAAGFKSCIIGNYQIVFCRPGDVAALGNDPYNSVPFAMHIEGKIRPAFIQDNFIPYSK